MSLITTLVHKGKQNPLSLNKAEIFGNVMGLNVQPISEELYRKALI
jgi:hypothetical protein